MNNGGEKRCKNSNTLSGGGGGPIDHIVLILADEKDDPLPFTQKQTTFKNLVF
jgi:hypothetical protein